jgi:hypothetical protein
MPNCAVVETAPSLHAAAEQEHVATTAGARSAERGSSRGAFISAVYVVASSLRYDLRKAAVELALAVPEECIPGDYNVAADQLVAFSAGFRGQLDWLPAIGGR